MPRWSLPPLREPELMDDPGLSAAEHIVALGALARINAVSQTARRLARAVVARLDGGGPAVAGPVRIVDVACGGGDVTVGLAARLGRVAAARGWDPPDVLGIDRSDLAIDRARRLAADRGVTARFLVADVTASTAPPCDVAVSSLFLHHLDDDDAIALLAALAATARRGAVISDLVRSRLGLALAVLGTTLLARSRVARIDGPRSVRAARTPAEYHALCAAAGIRGASVRRTWPERVLVEWPGQDRHAWARAS
jgi:2-polyprenyl-3-methyl-5-hydroxy-6-metoxy-1,4-benzoquinol methylase